ncbi:SagB family peptide dehydrogenase [Gordonia aquimaris]|uniref:SagB family peptide dehydrogenase n=1 Tax=Gordonia aquimaris TaxID=2984863 RepID=A0A9X3D2U5_9ACTN|nr:SagB family peptide dehydrogenase [Gordonia aquimaris]MCX2963771.1 SagB family peptide dehydrogenase [Gordonia aquimaris]
MSERTPHTVYTLAPGARFLLGGGGVAVVLPAKKRLDKLTRPQLAVLRSLNAGPITVSEGADTDVDSLVERLIDAGALSMTVSVGERKLYSLRPFRRPPTARPTVADVGDDVELSRFTVIRREDGVVVAENPLSWCDVEIHDPEILSVAGGLGSESPKSSVQLRLLSDLAWSGHAVAAGREHAEFPTRSWGPHELWFHRHSTVGDRATNWQHFGPTRWADGTFEPAPARRDVYPGEPIALPEPDLSDLRTADQPLAAVVEDRKSVRDFDDAHPISLAQLGELLFRCARTRSVRTMNADRPVPEELPSRPYPSGGSLYELEIYPVVRTADGVAPGMYHYDSFDHVLRPVAPYDSPAVATLFAPASLTLADGQLPQILLVLAARPGRIMWTYEQMPYAVILKHVGVLTQTLYLTATAMGLGGVAQGYGDTAAFGEATGVDELVECNVGSFVVGTPAKSS